MSEREILNRQLYKKKRKKWILIQTFAFVIAAVIAIGCFLTYNRLDRTYYIEYTEDSRTGYQVIYQENEYFDDLGCTLGEALLAPTVIYVKQVLRCIESADVKGISHITGGGFFENIPRCLPDGLTAKIEKAAIKTPAIFKMLQEKGNISEHDMFNTYNMGVGMIVIVPKEDVEKAIAALDCGAYVIGEIVAGDERVTLW